MKKRIEIIIISLVFPLLGMAQTRDRIVFDPTLNATIIAETGLEVATQEKIHEKQEEIADYKATIVALQASILNIETKTYNCLAQASSLINTVEYTISIGRDIDYIRQNLRDCMQIVVDEPYLLATTYEIDTLIITRIEDLASYVRNIAFVYDGDSERPRNLLNPAERMEIFYHVSNEIKIIRGYTNYMKYHLQTAKKQTVFQNLCPKTYEITRTCERMANNIINNFHLE